MRPNALTKSMGLGSVDNCPSLEQVMGITDPNDPCQGGVTSAAVGGVTATGEDIGDTTISNTSLYVMGGIALLMIFLSSGGGGKGRR
jgi:hypothetical protein